MLVALSLQHDEQIGSMTHPGTRINLSQPFTWAVDDEEQEVAHGGQNWILKANICSPDDPESSQTLPGHSDMSTGKEAWKEFQKADLLTVSGQVPYLTWLVLQGTKLIQTAEKPLAGAEDLLRGIAASLSGSIDDAEVSQFEEGVGRYP